MTKVYSKALNQTINIERFIGKLKSKSKGPSMILTAEFTAMSLQEFLPYSNWWSFSKPIMSKLKATYMQ